MSSPLAQERPPKKNRLAGLFAPAELKDSSLLPSYGWIISNVADIFKSSRELRKSLGRIGVFAALTLLSAGAGIAAIIMAGPLLATGIGAAALAGAAVFGKKIRNSWKNFKSNLLPKLRAELSVRYINMKGPRLVDKWKSLGEKDRPPQKSGSMEKNPVGKIQSLFLKLAVRSSKETPKEPPPVNNSAGTPP